MLKSYLITSACILLLCFLTWLWYLRTKLSSVIDVTWSLGILTAGTGYIFMSEVNLRKAIILFFLLVWSLRLAGYLYWTRVRLKFQDKRYQELSTEWAFPKIYFLGHYCFQGILMSIIALPFYHVGTNNQVVFSWTDYAASVLFLIAFFFESLSDWQLTKHKKYTSKVCDKGLWKYSRHPNYFFEWLIWVSFSIFSLGAEYGYFSVISPLCLLYIVTVLTAPLTEKSSLKSRGSDYALYQRKTSYFIPWFRRSI